VKRGTQSHQKLSTLLGEPVAYSTKLTMLPKHAQYGPDEFEVDSDIDDELDLGQH
jgi:hypothetical protein